jgi:hypothetical protein
MDKAERGTGGAFVNVIAYKADYVEVREDLKLIERTARTKKCSSPGERRDCDDWAFREIPS